MVIIGYQAFLSGGVFSSSFSKIHQLGWLLQAYQGRLKLGISLTQGGSYPPG